MSGGQVDGRGNMLGCLLYADDIVIIAENEGMLQDMLNILGEYGWDFKVKFSSDKSQVMVVEEGLKGTDGDWAF